VDAPTTYSKASTNLRLNAYVQGYGPLFTIKVEIENIGQTALIDVPMTLAYD
jgi:hypothetical protein